MVSEKLFVWFDMLTIFISFADVVTDVIVLYEWYIVEEWAYFYTSLSILILANLSYYVLFLRKICTQSSMSGWVAILILPFSPFLPYLLYFYESPHMCLGYTKVIKEWFHCRKSAYPKELLAILESMDEYNFDLKFKDILKQKINCHIGFILETFIESFPQSIIQMIAILQLTGNDETTSVSNIIIVSSIFLSLFSIAFKSILLLAVADLWTSMYNWTSAVIDFFNVFVIVSWLFLEINGNENGITSTYNLQWFVLGLIIVTTVPFYSTFIGFLFMSTYERSRYPPCICYEYCKKSCVFCVYLIILGLGVVMGQIFCCVFVALYIAKFGLYRFNDGNKGAIWAPVFKFIHHSSTNADRLSKVMVINQVLCGEMAVTQQNNQTEFDKFKLWLASNSENGFKDIKSFKQLQNRLYRDSFMDQITLKENNAKELNINNYGRYTILIEKIISYVCLPLYLFGRMIHLMFPIIIYILNLGFYGVNGIFLLHHVLTLSFIGLLILQLLVSYKVIYFTYCIYHIGYWSASPHLQKSIIHEIEDTYVDIIQLPIIIDFFDERFGEDVSKLIIQYMKSIQLS